MCPCHFAYLLSVVSFFLPPLITCTSHLHMHVDVKGSLPPLDICKSLESADYIRLLWTSAAEVPGIFITMFILTFIGRKIVIGLEMLIVTLFTGLLFLCIEE